MGVLIKFSYCDVQVSSDRALDVAINLFFRTFNHLIYQYNNNSEVYKNRWDKSLAFNNLFFLAFYLFTSNLNSFLDYNTRLRKNRTSYFASQLPNF